MHSIGGGVGFGVRDTVKGMVPGHICIVKSVLPKVADKAKPARKTSTKAAALKAQSDADKT
jgi:ribosome-associated protein